MKKLLASALVAFAALTGCSSTTLVEKQVVVLPEEVENFEPLRQSTVMLEIREGDTVRGSCSGVIIKPQVVLTAAHCDGSKLTIRGQGDAVKIRKDEEKDLMILYVEKLKGIPARVAWSQPVMDTKVVAVGYPLGMGQVLTEGRVQDALILDDVPAEFRTRLDHLFLVSSPVVFGNSGGPVFAKVDGVYMLVGIMSRMAVAGYGSPITHLAMAVKPSAIIHFLHGV